MEIRSLHCQTTEALLASYAASPDARLRATIIERHGNLVRFWAQKFVRTGVPVEDLVQAGWVALIGAVDRFDPAHQTRFSSYAIHCMVGEIKRYLRDRTWSMRVPRDLQEIAANMNRMRDDLCRTLQRQPTVEEMAAGFKIPEEEFLQAMDLGHAYRPCSLDQRWKPPNGDDTSPLHETVGRLDRAMESVVERVPLEDAIRTLDPRKQKIVRRRYFEGCSQREVAGELGLSQMHVCRLERSALHQLNVLIGAP